MSKSSTTNVSVEDCFSPQSCLPYLQGALTDFRDGHPDWYMFITENKLVHYGSGKYIFADEEDITTVEAAPHPQVAVICTPEKRMASRAAGTPIRLFSILPESRSTPSYMKSALMMEKADCDIAAFILRSECITSESARNELSYLKSYEWAAFARAPVTGTPNARG